MLTQVGHAIRIAQMEGMHTQLPEDVLGSSTVVRCRNIWWSLYIMDRQFSPSLGLPMTTQDSDISTLINPQVSDPRDVTFSLQVRITRMLSFIISGKSCLNYHAFSTSNMLNIKRSIKRRKRSLEHF
jgi:hypothetical protein